MDDGHLLKPSVLKSLKQNKHLKLKQLLGAGSFLQGILLEVYPNQEAIGKIVSLQNEGEFIIWPSLRHESLIPLLEIVVIDENKWLFVCPYLKTCLELLVQDAGFIKQPKCFDRKTSYVRDVLSGLEYLHQMSLSLMNLSDQNVLVCSKSDRAIISDFSCCVSVETATKLELPVDKIKFLPPELRQLEDSEAFECRPIDMWSVGILALQIFTGLDLPTIDNSEDVLSGLTMELLSKANAGAHLGEELLDGLNEFLNPIFREDPGKRIDAKEAIKQPFLRSSARRLDEQARKFWKMKDAYETLSNASKMHVSQRKCGKKSKIFTMCDGNNFDDEVRVKGLKTMCSENISYRKAKSELYLEKSVPQGEGKIPHNGSTFLYCQNYKNSNDADPEKEPHLFYDFIKLPHAPSSANFDPFFFEFHKDFSTNTHIEFNSRLEKDPWGESDEELSSSSDSKISKSWSQIEASSSNSTTSNVSQDKYLAPISNFPSNSYGENLQDDIQETSSINEQLVANLTCEQFHQAGEKWLANNGHQNTHEYLQESCANNSKNDVMKKRRFPNVSWRHGRGRVEKISMVPYLQRRNACRIKMGTKVKNQFGCRSVSQRVHESILLTNVREIFLQDDTQETSLPIKEQEIYLSSPMKEQKISSSSPQKKQNITPCSPIKEQDIFQSWLKNEHDTSPSSPITEHVIPQSLPIKEHMMAKQACEQAMLADIGHCNMNRFMQPAPELIPATNIRDIFVHDQMDETAFAFLMNEMHCYNLMKRPADKPKKPERVIKAKRDHLLQGMLPRKTESENYEVDISPDLPLCSNMESTNGINVVKKTLPKKKATNRFLRMLCPGSKTESKFDKVGLGEV